MNKTGIVLNVSAEVNELLCLESYSQSNPVMIDARSYFPFGEDYDYSKEAEINVTRLFATQKFFKDCTDDPYEAIYLNNWLAILDHYGFERQYASVFLWQFEDYLNSSLLRIYHEEQFDGNYRDQGTPVPRLFHGTTYKRTEFIDAFCCFFEKHGYEI